MCTCLAWYKATSSDSDWCTCACPCCGCVVVGDSSCGLCAPSGAGVLCDHRALHGRFRRCSGRRMAVCALGRSIHCPSCGCCHDICPACHCVVQHVRVECWLWVWVCVAFSACFLCFVFFGFHSACRILAGMRSRTSSWRRHRWQCCCMVWATCCYGSLRLRTARVRCGLLSTSVHTPACRDARAQSPHVPVSCAGLNCCVCAHAACHGSCCYQLHCGAAGRGFALLSFVVYPAVFFAGLALRTWRDASWRVTRTVIALFAFSQAWLIGFCAAVTVYSALLGMACFSLYVHSTECSCMGVCVSVSDWQYHACENH